MTGAPNAIPGIQGFVSVPLEKRFWAKVDRRGDDECWPWLGFLNNQGYGTLRQGVLYRRASQVSWELEHGLPFPEGKFACHSCDNPSCVNPKHLWVGTALDNFRDAVKKGRINQDVLSKPNLNRMKTTCDSGHSLTGANVSIRKNGNRNCRECHRLRSRDRRVFNRELEKQRVERISDLELEVANLRALCREAADLYCQGGTFPIHGEMSERLRRAALTQEKQP